MGTGGILIGNGLTEGLFATTTTTGKVKRRSGSTAGKVLGTPMRRAVNDTKATRTACAIFSTPQCQE